MPFLGIEVSRDALRFGTGSVLAQFQGLLPLWRTAKSIHQALRRQFRFGRTFRRERGVFGPDWLQFGLVID